MKKKILNVLLKADSFSPFAIVYKDVIIPVVNPSKSYSLPKTGID